MSVSQQTCVALTVIAESAFRLTTAILLFNPTCYNEWQAGKAELDKERHFKRLNHKSLLLTLNNKAGDILYFSKGSLDL